MHTKTVGAYEAKTHLSALLEEVAQGERIIITRNGIPIATLTPYKEQKHSIQDTIDAMLVFRKKLHLKGLSIRDMRDEGRR